MLDKIFYESHEHKLEHTSNYKGYDYVVIGHKYGHRCGYVKIPKSHQLFETSESKIYELYPNLSVHGGITFMDYMKGKNSKTYCIGFDAGHCCDAKDPSLLSEKYKDLFSSKFLEYGEIRTLEYMISECESLIDQIR
jgi:hypothetical protein